MPDRVQSDLNPILHKPIPSLAPRGQRRTPPIASQLTVLNGRAPRRVTTQLQLPTGKRDVTALTSVIDEWLVPLLVKEFLAELNAGAKPSDAHKTQPKGPQKRKQ